MDDLAWLILCVRDIACVRYIFVAHSVPTLYICDTQLAYVICLWHTACLLYIFVTHNRPTLYICETQLA